MKRKVMMALFAVALLALLWLIFPHGERNFIWNPDTLFLHDDDEPFGCELFDKMAEATLPNGYSYYQGSLDDLLSSKERRSLLLVCGEVSWDEYAAIRIDSFIRRGNNLMLVCNECYGVGDYAWGSDRRTKDFFKKDDLREVLKGHQAPDTLYCTNGDRIPVPRPLLTSFFGTKSKATYTSSIGPVLSKPALVKRKAKQVLKSTWGVFKKILFNPITIILLVGGLFLFFGPKLIEWLTGLVGGIRDTLIPVLSKYAKKAIEILTPIWNCLCFIGKILFRVVKWLTDPDNFIVKAITAIIKMVLMFKGFLKKMMKVAGKSSIDILCMFLAGDTIGIALHTAIGLLKTIWNYVQKKGIIRKIKNLFKQFPKLYLMIWAIPGTFLASIANASWAFLKWLGSKVGIGDDKAVSSVADAFCKPWKLWWSVIENIMNDGDAPEIPKDQFLTVDPITQTEGIKSETKISVKKLGMVGTNASIVMGKMDELTKMSGFNTDKTMLKRIKGMESLYEYNTIQVMEFDKFLSGIAEMSKKNDENSERLLSMLLEDPDLSQKILSVFFYYNPQTQETQMLRPMQFIGQFVKNLQGLMSPSNSDSWGKRLELLVDALD